MRRKLIRRACVIALLLGVYPVCIIAFTWSYVLKSDFKGGRDGQLDAYRHALASATVSYTLGKWAVSLTTWSFESGKKDSGKMDAHNNQIGAAIGSEVKSFYEIEPAVRQSVVNGNVDAINPGQITWLSPTKWRESKLW
jgi:preprotein translocase subunit SecF